jgi:hypothetical protein
MGSSSLASLVLACQPHSPSTQGGWGPGGLVCNNEGVALGWENHAPSRQKTWNRARPGEPGQTRNANAPNRMNGRGRLIFQFAGTGELQRARVQNSYRLVSSWASGAVRSHQVLKDIPVDVFTQRGLVAVAIRSDDDAAVPRGDLIAYLGVSSKGR